MAPPRRRALWGWCLYDWANSAFPTVVVTFVFATYFTQGVAADVETGTAQWAQAMAIAGLLAALASPAVGAVADQTGRRKPWLAVLTVVAVIATASLWWVHPDPAWAGFALVAVVVAAVAVELGTVFYNAMLPEVAAPERLGRVSGWGWGLGYAGGLVCLAAALALVKLSPPPFGLDTTSAEPVRATSLLAAGWLAVFCLPLFLWVPDRPPTGQALLPAVARGFADLWATARNLRQYRQIAWFILARMLYMDGVNTLFAFGGIYAAGSFGMAVDEIILFGIALNVVAGAGAAAFGWLDDRLGAKRTVTLSLVGLIACGLPLLVVEGKTLFWAFALPLCLFVGPVQSASRSLMARLAPEERRTEMFGLFAFSGRVTAFFGPAVLGWATLAFGSQRAGMATILLFLAGGLLLLRRVREGG